MINGLGDDRALSTLVVLGNGAIAAALDPWEPVRLIDGDGEPVIAGTAFLRELQSSSRSAAQATSNRRTVLHLFETGRWTELLVSMITTLLKLPAPAS